MCGGSDEHPQVPLPVPPGGGGAPPAGGGYTAPDLRANYKNFRDSGTVPYSYYGQGAPSNPDELARVKQAYGGSFAPGAPAPSSGMERLMAMLRQFSGGRIGGAGGAQRPVIARQ